VLALGDAVRELLYTLGAFVGISGFLLIAIPGDWRIAVGVFLMLFGNNLVERGQR